MKAIVRPGPYICAEWDNGGLPAWLFNDPTVGVRSSESGYLAAVSSYMEAVLAVVAPRQMSRGGPVILIQIENEYGAYGKDKEYLQHLVDLSKRSGVDVPLFTCDQPFGTMIEDGSLPELHKTGTFGSRADERLAFLRERQPTGPLMCAEFWNGWFDNWGTHHHTTDAAASAAELDALLTAGASVNIYMFHGGTNFGFTNGTNDKGIYEPTITSYDYDAPLSEDGHPTTKYFAFRDVIAKHFPVPEDVPAGRPALEGSLVAVSESAPLLAHTGPVSLVPGPVPAVEVTGQYRGFYVYEVDVPSAGVLSFSEVRDRAQFFLNGVPVGVLSRELGERAISLPYSGRLQILLEDQGRVNYGQRIGESKGLIGPALLNGVELLDWKVGAVDLNSLDSFREAAAELPVGVATAGVAGPSISFASFEADGSGDRFLRLDGWTKGNVFINGFNLGRYWSRGPQRTLYVPGPLIREGTNELAILELHGSATSEASFAVGPDLGPDEK